MNDYPAQAVPVNHVEPAPMRVRAYLGGEKVLDTTSARYVWEGPNYPQFYVPSTDVSEDFLEKEDTTQATGRGAAELYGLHVGERRRPHAVRFYPDSPIPGVAGTMRLDWDALDAWYEEDERVFVHPRSPYVRVDALRSTRAVRIALDGIVLAESASPLMLFETGLPTRYYLDRTSIRFKHLVESDTVTACPYKGTTSGYWSVRAGNELHTDLAWSYDFPTRHVLPIAGLIAFYNEKLDITLDGELLARPTTHFS